MLNTTVGQHRVKEGHTSIKDEPRQGRPSDVNTPEKQEAVNDFILAERRITVEEIARQLDMSTGTANHIINEVLKFSTVSCHWVPKMLTPEHKQNRLDISRKLLDPFYKGETLLQRIITCDETWAFHYEPETKQQSTEWRHISPVKKIQISLHYRKMMTVFWDMKGHITVDFWGKSTSMNSEMYCEILNTVRHDVCSKRRGLTSKGVLFHQDNARSHTGKKTVELIENF